jgi:hypothetical protein
VTCYIFKLILNLNAYLLSWSAILKLKERKKKIHLIDAHLSKYIKRRNNVKTRQGQSDIGVLYIQYTHQLALGPRGGLCIIHKEDIHKLMMTYNSVKPLVPAAFAVVSTQQLALGLRDGLWSVLLVCNP